MKRAVVAIAVTLGSVVWGWAPSALAQAPAKMPRIGVTMAGTPSSPFVAALRRGLTEHGWIEGQNIVIEYRYAEGQPGRYPALMAELVRLKVDLIVAGGGTVAALAAKQATTSVPVVMPVAADPVGSGLVASLARPGGNLTGLSMLNTELSAKRVGLLKEAFPKVTRVAMLYDPGVDDKQVNAAQEAARSLGLRLQPIAAGRVEEFEGAFEAARKGRAEALIFLVSSFFNAHRQRLVQLAERRRLPAVYEREFAAVGALVAYGPNVSEMYRASAKYVDRILKGARPADLPVEQPTKFELVINLKAAKALGLMIPQSLLLRADQVIQ